MLRVFESEGAKELAKVHIRVSCLKWHGERQQWIVEFRHDSPDVEYAKFRAKDYVETCYQAQDVTFWKRKGHEVENLFYVAFDMGQVSLEGYKIVTPS